VSVYTEREDEEDEEEMLEGVADWEYPENDGEGGEVSSSDDESELSDAPPEEDENGDSNKASDNDEPPEAEADKPEEARFNGTNAAPALKSRGASKPAVKASVLAEVKRPTRSTRSRRGKGTDDMEIDADE
jgi:sister-chromatid-cohesion protein PDS5